MKNIKWGETEEKSQVDTSDWSLDSDERDSENIKGQRGAKNWFESSDYDNLFEFDYRKNPEDIG